MRIAAIVNMMTPYSTPLFAGMAATPGVELLVVYETVAEPNRRWDMAQELPFEHVVLDSWTADVSRFAVGSGMKVVTDHYLHLPRHPLRPLAQFAPEVVIAGGGGAWASPANVTALGARMRREWGVVSWWGSIRRASPTLPRRLAGPWVRYYVRSCDAWVAYGSRAARDVRELGADPDRIVIAPFASPHQARSAEAGSRGSEAGGPCYLFVGQLIERKGIFQLLRAFAALPGGELWIAGEGPLRSTVESAAAGDPRIRYVGHIGAGELERLYGAADVLVVPSLYEVWGLVVNEGLAYGLPVIATDETGATEDLVIPGVTGAIVEAGSEEQLRAAMVEVGAWPEERRARCAREASKLLDRWSIEAEVAGFLRASELALEHRRASRNSRRARRLVADIRRGSAQALWGSSRRRRR